MRSSTQHLGVSRVRVDRTSLVSKLPLHHLKALRLVALGVLSLSLISTPSAQAQGAQFQQFYVSKTNSQKPGKLTGKSWTDAWGELDQIDSSVVTPGSYIYIDGGTSNMTYNTSLVIKNNGIHIQRSVEPGHNGQVVIDGKQNSNSVGIEFGDSSGVWVSGMGVTSKGEGGIAVRNMRQDGVHMGANSTGDYVRFVELDHNGRAGLESAGDGNYLDYSVVHDNGIANVLKQEPITGTHLFFMSNSWIYNSDYSHAGDGLLVNPPACNNSSSAPRTTYIRECAFGPALNYGIRFFGLPNGLFVYDSLLLDSTFAGVRSTAICALLNITSFMTPHNKNGTGHNFINFSTYGCSVDSSIVYGGGVVIPNNAWVRLGQNNTQYNTTVNKVALAPKMIDPLFVSAVATLDGAVPVSTLEQLDFSLSANSPAKGTGTSVTSVNSLLNVISGSGYPPP
jgi:hypothetical protein